jgi:hypothetical protein
MVQRRKVQMNKAGVTFSAEEWAQLCTTFAQLMSVFSSHDEVAEATRVNVSAVQRIEMVGLEGCRRH